MEKEKQPGLERQAEVDLGYDDAFEQQWEAFERCVWFVFMLLLIAGRVGSFGRGPLNQVKLTFDDGTTLQYERILRFKSPTVMNYSTARTAV
jgi:hypothetical protein